MRYVGGEIWVHKLFLFVSKNREVDPIVLRAFICPIGHAQEVSPPETAII